MPYTAAIGGAVIAAGSTAYGVHESNKAAEAATSFKPPAPPGQPLAAEQATAAQLQKGNLLAQSAGGTLLSDPTKAGGGVGSATKPAATIVGTG